MSDRNLSRVHLAETGHTCELQTTEFFESGEDFRNYVVENDFCSVIGIHFWRAGKLLLGVTLFQLKYYYIVIIETMHSFLILFHQDRVSSTILHDIWWH